MRLRHRCRRKWADTRGLVKASKDYWLGSDGGTARGSSTSISRRRPLQEMNLRTWGAAVLCPYERETETGRRCKAASTGSEVKCERQKLGLGAFVCGDGGL